MSFDELPTMMRNSPGSTTHRMSRSSIRSASFDNGIDTVFDSPGARRTRWKPASCMTGRATDASTSRMYS